VQCDFQLRHPYPGNLKLTGFDVRGVLVTDGDTLFPVSNRLVSLDGSNPTLIDPDGYTALFNPTEFPSGSAPWPMLGYIDGKFSNGDNFTATLNPFMAYCTDNPRRMFEAGATETVTVNLKYPSVPFEFGYVVDASWVLVDEVVDPLADFPPEATCLEPYRLDLQMIGTLTNEPGDSTGITVEVFDHQGIETVSYVTVECPDLFDGEVELEFAYQSGDDAWLYYGVITNESGAAPGDYTALVKANSLEVDSNLGELATFNVENISVYYAVVGDGDLIWAKQAGGTSNDQGHEITTLSDNSTVATGIFFDTATFGSGEPNETHLVSSGSWDIFIARYNPDGSLAWAKNACGPSEDSGKGITTLSDNSTVVTGSFSNSAIFGAGETNETLLNTSGDYDVFIARYNPDGSLVWAKKAGGTERDYCYGITSLSDNSTVVTGAFKETAIFGPGEPNETYLVESYISDFNIFIARYNPDGSLAWAKKAGGNAPDFCWEVTALSDNSTVVTGYFEGTAIFGPGESNEKQLVSSGNNDIFFARYNPDGSLAWAKSAGGAHDDFGRGITTLSDNSTVVTGYFSNSAIFGAGETNETLLNTSGDYDVFIARYNPDGSLAWAKKAGGTGEDVGHGITTLSDNSTVVTGHFKYSAIFGPGEINETQLVASGWDDIFIARYNPDGSLAWAKKAGGTNNEAGSGFTALSDDSIVVTGYFNETAIFGPGEANETQLVSSGSFDIFIARYSP
jgi:uncharacterized delta-60 repeat protein